MRRILPILIRLPLAFLVTFIVLAGGWTLYLFKELNRLLHLKSLNPFEAIPVLSGLDDILISAAIVALYVAGLLVIYNFSVFINWALVRYGLKPTPHPVVHPHRPPAVEVKDDRFSNIKKIGIVLAGGGAKGAFQAGAMKAIYQFLAEHNALDKVSVVSCTSIGSWNALFWLADLIKSEKGWEDRSAHESWWRSIKLKSLVAPSWYVPCFRNAFFVTTPWQRAFDSIFGQPDVKKRIVESKIHFYLTRSHVISGKLQCTTNNQQRHDIPKVSFNRLDPSKGHDEFLENVKTGVFASMDLPPLFPYMKMGDEFFEDGGVIDNLPVLFAAMEQCDLIFVLPLNSDFTAALNRTSVLKRFLRVMDVRQGALERSSLKNVYLYNELAVLREYARALEAKLTAAKAELPAIEKSSTLDRALNRTHQQSKIFAVCPLRTFAESTIDTQDLWKSSKAGDAFSVMRKSTKNVLVSSFNPRQEQIKVALVDPAGNIFWDENF